LGGAEGGFGGVLASIKERMAMRGPVPASGIVAAVAEHFAVTEAAIMGAGGRSWCRGAGGGDVPVPAAHGMKLSEIGRALGGQEPLDG